LIGAPGTSLSAGVPGSLLGAEAEATEKVLFLFDNEISEKPNPKIPPFSNIKVGEFNRFFH
jgi:hypothetical protein